MKKKFILPLIFLSCILLFKCGAQVTYPCGKYLIGMNGTSDYGLWNQAYNSPDITMAAWVKITDSQSFGKKMTIFYRYDFNTYGENTDLSLSLNESGQFVFKTIVLNTQDQRQIYDSLLFNFRPAVSKWYHVAVTFNGSNYVGKTYINAVETNSKSFAGPISYVNVGSAYSHSISFGARYVNINGGFLNNYFKGQLDEAAYCAKELSVTQLKILAQGVAAGDTFLKQNVAIYHKFDDYPTQPNYGNYGGTLPTVGQYYYCPQAPPPNVPPVAKAGPEQTITLPTNSATLDGSSSSDVDGTITGYQWRQKYGIEQATITGADNVKATLTNLKKGAYRFILTVTDDQGAKDSAEVTVNVLDDKSDSLKCPGFTIDISSLYKDPNALQGLWVSGDGLRSIDPAKADTGVFMRINTYNGGLVTLKTLVYVRNHPKPDLGPDKTQLFLPVTYANESHLFDDSLSTHPNYNILSWTNLSGLAIDPTLVDFQEVHLTVTNEFGCLDTAAVYPGLVPVTGILPATAQTVSATTETTGPDGITNYYYEAGGKKYLLLSIKKDGNDIGSVTDGTLKVKIVSTQNAATGKGIKITNPLVTNASGYFVMNRYWQVIPKKQPVTPVTVSFYYTTKDFDDVKGSVPTITNHQQLQFYKTNGGNPNPETNLDSATSLIYLEAEPYASSYTWVYRNLGYDEHQGTFKVDSFSGGGGAGATIDGKPFLTAAQIQTINLCPGGSINLQAPATGTSYKWLVNTGAGFVPLSASTNYSGVSTATLSLNNIPSSYYGYQYACLIDGNIKVMYQLKFTTTWLATGSTAWEDPANWDCGKIPDNNTDVILSSGNVIISISTACRSVVIKPGAKLTVKTGVNFKIL